MSPASTSRLLQDWKELCRKIGPRPAGSAAESAAAAYLARRFSEAGLSAEIEHFPCRSYLYGRASAAARLGRGWNKAEGLPLVNSASTPGEGTVEGEIAWIEGPADFPAIGANSLRGKIALVFGQLPGDTRGYRALVAARPLAILQVDDRLPFSWPIQNALLPEWVRNHGAVPTAGIAYQTAWKWRVGHATRARVAIAARHRSGRSSNVVATLAGSDPDLPAILFGAHHDTPPGIIGADDNASGVVTLLELARLLAGPGAERRRTLIFASFGTEEQLSVGSAAYVRRHRRELGGIGLVINFDSVASPLGHRRLSHSGQPGLGRHFQDRLARRGFRVEVDATVNPFSDHFPFTAFGVPALWFYRSNERGNQRWQHHSRYDSLGNVSADELRLLIGALGPIVRSLSRPGRWPFGKGQPPPLAAQTAEYARKWYGLRV